LTELPPGKTLEDKRVFGAFLGERMIGCVDVARGYPGPGTAFVGLVLLAEPHQRSGHGTRLGEALESWLQAEWPEVRTLRLAVYATNEAALRFWEKVGYRATGERRLRQERGRDKELILMEKALAPGGKGRLLGLRGEDGRIDILRVSAAVPGDPVGAGMHRARRHRRLRAQAEAGTALIGAPGPPAAPSETEPDEGHIEKP
jgi:hypothetical protein